MKSNKETSIRYICQFIVLFPAATIDVQSIGPSPRLPINYNQQMFFDFLCSFILLLQPFFRHGNWLTDLRILFRLHHSTSHSEQGQWIVFFFHSLHTYRKFSDEFACSHRLRLLLSEISMVWSNAGAANMRFSETTKVSNPHAIRFISILTAVIYFVGFQENRWQKPTARRCRLSCSHTIVWPVFFLFCSKVFLFLF